MISIAARSWAARGLNRSAALGLLAGLGFALITPALAQSQGLVGLRQVAAADMAAPKPAPPAAAALRHDPILAGNPHLVDGADRAELSFAITGPASPASFVLAGPDRIVVDLPHVMFEPARHAAETNPNGLVASYRFGLFAVGKSRIVIDLAGPARVLRAAVVDNAGHSRLIISLARTDRASFLTAARETLSAAAAPPPAPVAVSSPASDLPIIVVDPGHGGIDSGAAVHGLIEKNIVFAFAKELADKLEASGHYKVIMTRDSDVFVALGQRVQIARDAGASLFVSIHADTLAGAGTVSGATVYTCSEHASDAEAARTAEKENQADAVAGVESKDEDDGVSDILFDLTRQETQTYSRVFARTLVNYWQVASRLNKNPERYAGFRVLKAPDVPSVLIELGYLSNAGDGTALTSARWRDTTTGQVVAAIDAFFTAKGVLPEKSAAAQPTLMPVDMSPTATAR
jgi:N-acetylmuramoyl-L-alanine amidase